MKLIALILGLLFERVATQLLHLRELRLFDRYFDAGLRLAGRFRSWRVHAVVIAMLVVLAAPVLVVSIALRGEEAALNLTEIGWDLPYLVFAVFIVFLCLGPRDLGNEVDEYCRALDDDDAETARRVLIELSESEQADTGDLDDVEDAIFVQATNRIFGVVFWFVLLGPVGAWLFRVADLLRRRARFEAARAPDLAPGVRLAVATVDGVLKWIPARLAAIGYALTGSFDDAINSWSGAEQRTGVPFHESNDEIVARVGKAAMAGYLDEPANTAAAARNSMRLVTRTLFLWVTILAVMTIFGWAV